MSTADSVPTPDSSASADPPTAVPLATVPMRWTVETPVDERRESRDMLTGVWRREATAWLEEEEEETGGGGPGGSSAVKDQLKG